MELSFVIGIIVLGSGYIAFPFAKVFLAFIRGFNFNKENYIHDIPFFKENIPAFSVQGKSRSISVLLKNLVTIIQNISES